MSNRVKTGKVRASFLNVIIPRAAQEGQPPKYSVALLISKKDKKTLDELKSAIADAIEIDRAGKNHLKGVKTPKNPLHDGDGEKPNGGEYGPECAGCYVLNASCKDQPGLVDRDNNVMKEKGEWYSGIYVRADITFAAYNTAGSKGVGCFLNHLKKLADGEPLSGAGNPELAFNDDYEDEDEDII